MDIYIGIDLAWGEKNLSGFCVLESSLKSKNLKILDLKLLKSIDEIVQEIQKYKEKNLVDIAGNYSYKDLDINKVVKVISEVVAEKIKNRLKD